jgi:predicted aspartyl protease
MGEPTGFEEVDLSSAMRSIEFLGKVHKMTSGDEGGARVTLHVVNIADKQVRDTDSVVSEQ